MGRSGRRWVGRGESDKVGETVGRSGRQWEGRGDRGKVGETVGRSGRQWEGRGDSGKVFLKVAFLWIIRGYTKNKLQ